MGYSRAWQCKRCPKSNDEDGCPAWAELIETHVRSGEERVTKECVFRLLPRLMLEVVKASNRPAAEIGELRSELYQGFTALARVAPRLEEKDASTQ